MTTLGSGASEDLLQSGEGGRQRGFRFFTGLGVGQICDD